MARHTAKHLPLQLQNKTKEQAKEHRIVIWRNMTKIQRNNRKEMIWKTRGTHNRRKKIVEVQMERTQMLCYWKWTTSSRKGFQLQLRRNFNCKNYRQDTDSGFQSRAWQQQHFNPQNRELSHYKKSSSAFRHF